MDAKQRVVLVDENDNALGFAEKLSAHQDGGKLHRAFSVMVFNSRNEVLLQLRSREKYHFGGLWSNTCCGHPSGEYALVEEAQHRLSEEFGFESDLTEKFTFVYVADDPDSDLIEREFDHVLVGTFDGIPNPHPDEIDDYKWMPLDDLHREVKEHPDHYTPWFRLLLERF